VIMPRITTVYNIQQRSDGVHISIERQRPTTDRTSIVIATNSGWARTITGGQRAVLTRSANETSVDFLSPSNADYGATWVGSASDGRLNYSIRSGNYLTHHELKAGEEVSIDRNGLTYSRPTAYLPEIRPHEPSVIGCSGLYSRPPVWEAPEETAAETSRRLIGRGRRNSTSGRGRSRYM
jgi:hypothetical protein